jgi:hypothetical protein
MSIEVFTVGGLRGLRNLPSRAIEYVSFGPYSHAGFWSVPDWTKPGYVYDSREDCIGGASPGVQYRDADYLNIYPRFTMFEFDTTFEQEARLVYFLREQQDLPYDKPAIFGFAADRDWRDPNSWFCSELVAAALEYANIVPRLHAPANKITPVALGLAMSAAGARWRDVYGHPTESTAEREDN